MQEGYCFTAEMQQCVTFEHRLTETAFEWFMGEIESKFTSALVSAGEMAGVVGAQFIGEPVTQMTLRERERGRLIYLAN